MSWLSWTAEAFAQAKSQGKPVLAAVGPLPHETLRVAQAQIERQFVPVLADPESRPDAAARIGAGRAIVLDADGGRRGVLSLPDSDLSASLSRLAEEALLDRAADVAPAAPVWSGAVREKPLGQGPEPSRVARVFAELREAGSVRETALEALLYAACERGDSSARDAFARGLWASIAGVWDSARGVFLLDGTFSLAAHSRRTRLLWEAHALTGEQRWRDAAAAATRVLLGPLHDPQVGAFRRAPGEAVYPADGNAAAALALLRAEAFGVEGAAPAAAKSLIFVQTRLYDPLLGLVHSQGGEGEGVHGLLGDAAWTALAFTEAFLSTGLKTHREFADGLVRFLFQELWERDGGGFLDRVTRAGDPAILREPRVDPELNAVALEACWRLHHLKGNANYRRWHDWGLRAAWIAAGEDCAPLAGLARAADMSARPRLDFELVGRPGEPRAAALLAALRRHCLPRAIVSFVDPDDQDYILAHKLTAGPYPRLFACAEDLRPLADAADPARVPELVAAARSAEAA